MKILIADDSRLSRAALMDALDKLGHQVIEAKSGEEAIELFQSQGPDLVILDVIMTGITGFECAKQLREINHDWIPIIFLSSSLDDEYISQGIDAGGDDYLTKPFSFVTLSAKIKAMQRIADMRNELIKSTKKLKLLSSTDALTGLYNRFHFEKKLTEVFAQAERHKYKFALMFIDIDYFKDVNDQYGHHTGDLVLKEVSQRIRSCLRANDFVARLGGDEFALILQISFFNEQEVEVVAKKILKLGAKPYAISDKEISITFSIGIAFFPEAGENPETLLINADFAMYYIKNKGRNNYKIFHPSLRGRA
jgi:diguanylate cyclase (GGDEF)-like protein